MIKIGITGGIGTGKTIVCQIFETFNIPVYYSDLRAKHLMENDSQLIQQIIENFGQVYTETGKLNRKKLAQIIFNDRSKLQTINQIVHPAVKRDFLKWAERQQSPYVIKESALLFESKQFTDLDFIVTVWAPLELRIQRTMKRDNVSRQKVLERINNQLDEQFKIYHSHFIIINDEQTPLLPQILNLHKFFLKQNR